MRQVSSSTTTATATATPTTTPPKRGGKREGAGRKRSRFRLDAPHRKRPALSSTTPVHVVMRGRVWISGLRRGRVYRALRHVLANLLGDPSFRIVHISIQDNHLHSLVEAANKQAMTRGMRRFTINAARAIQKACETRGPVFYRYHSTQISTARYARNALAYVLNNWRRHKQDFENGRFSTAKLDRYSSAISFDGWTQKLSCPADHVPLPVSPPRTELLCRGWRAYGLIDPFEAPGPLALVRAGYR